MPDPPTAAEIDGFSRGGSKDCPGLRQRCRVLGMEQAGTNDELKLRLKVYFGYAGTNDEREALMYPEPEVKMYVPLTTSASASTGVAASASVASGSASESKFPATFLGEGRTAGPTVSVQPCHLPPLIQTRQVWTPTGSGPSGASKKMAAPSCSGRH